MSKVQVVGKDKDGNEKIVFVVSPDEKDYREAQRYAGKVFTSAVADNAVFREKLDEALIKQGLWSKAKQKEVEQIQEDIESKLVELKRGGISLTRARELAIDIRKKRLERTLKISVKAKNDEYTVEGMADNAKFEYLVYRCVKDEEGNRVFESVEDYQNKSSEDYVVKAATKFADMYYGMDADWEKKLPETKFLIKYGFMNEDMQLVDKDGNRVDVRGRRVNDKGFLINENGDRIDEDGNLIDEDGLPLIESQPFLDDDGNPVS